MKCLVKVLMKRLSNVYTYNLFSLCIKTIYKCSICKIVKDLTKGKYVSTILPAIITKRKKSWTSF